MIEKISDQTLIQALPDLSEILHACVLDGASVGFILPFERIDAKNYWKSKVFPLVNSGTIDMFVGKIGDRVWGTVQLVPAQMPNQPHRADVSKLLVHPDARRQGIASALLQALEERALDLGITLLTLDTRSTDPSLKLYLSHGFQIAGEIPDFCRNPFREEYESTTYMFKKLQ